jgi:RimJ/RimL family protein N-acetyltransferase
MELKYQNNNIRIRPYVDEDIVKLYECVINSQPEFRKYLPWANTEYKLEHSKAWVSWADYNWRSRWQYDFVIEDIKTNEFLGGVGLLEVDFYSKQAKLGYWIATAHTGKGLTTQAAQLAIEFARKELGLEKLVIRIAADNARSIAIAKKLGASYVYTEPTQEFHNNRWQDVVVYELPLN